MAELIEISGASYAPSGVPVLDDITFSSSARRIGIVGRNGSGKTSFARLLAGLIVADRGSVRVAGADVARDRKAALGAVGILFQNPDHQIIFPTVQEEIAFGLLQMGQSKSDAAKGVAGILTRFGKTHWAEAAIYRLSHGQRQLVCLMSVLAMQPKVIVLDEPVAGLDIPTAAHLTRVLAGVDATLVQITHDPASLQGYDRVLWLEGGRVAQDGVAADVLADFSQAMQQLGEDDDLSDLAR